MEIPVSVFVLIVTSATLAGGLLGAMLISRRDRRPLAHYRETLDQLRVARSEASAAKRLRTDVSRLTEQLEGATQRETVRDGQAVVAVRELAEYRSHMDNIIGLEAEVAALRVIAARVPALERHIAELEPDVIDLRERRRHLAD